MRVPRLLPPVLAVATLAALLAVSAPPASASPRPTIAGVAKSNIGKHACSRNSRGGRGFFTSCTGNGGQPEYWCADFAKWVWAQAGVADTRGLTASAGSFYAYGERFGTLSATPAVGDAAVFNYYGGGVAEHVAIVTEVYANGTIETVSGDWNGDNGNEARFASTSTVVLNDPAYPGAIGGVPDDMGMVVSAFVEPVGIRVTPVMGESALPAGGKLAPGQSLSSPNDVNVLDMELDGNLVEYVGGRPTWSTNTTGDAGAFASLQAGDLVVYNQAGTPVWQSETSGHPGAELLLRNDGALLIAGSSGVLWSRYPVNGILPQGKSLTSGQEIVSPNEFNRVVMQSDGNLVEYTAGRVLWATNTKGHPGAFAILQPKGNFVVYSAMGKPLWSTATGGHAGTFVLALTNDGDLVVTGPSGSLWANQR